MFLVKDKYGASNPWLAFQFDRWLWTRKKEDAFKFNNEIEARQTGVDAMPMQELKNRVIVVSADE